MISCLCAAALGLVAFAFCCEEVGLLDSVSVVDSRNLKYDRDGSLPFVSYKTTGSPLRYITGSYVSCMCL